MVRVEFGYKKYEFNDLQDAERFAIKAMETMVMEKYDERATICWYEDGLDYELKVTRRADDDDRA
jgi:hypothetical protein